MMDAAEKQNSNVIEISFNKDSIGAEFSPSEPLDDPLLDLLHEFDDLVEDELKKGPKDQDFIYHLEEKKNFNLKLEDNTVHMTDVLLDQTTRLKEDIKRLTYYLDEMYIDK